MVVRSTVHLTQSAYANPPASSTAPRFLSVCSACGRIGANEQLALAIDRFISGCTSHLVCFMKRSECHLYLCLEAALCESSARNLARLAAHEEHIAARHGLAVGRTRAGGLLCNDLCPRPTTQNRRRKIFIPPLSLTPSPEQLSGSRNQNTHPFPPPSPLLSAAPAATRISLVATRSS